MFILYDNRRFDRAAKITPIFAWQLCSSQRFPLYAYAFSWESAAHANIFELFGIMKCCLINWLLGWLQVYSFPRRELWPDAKHTLKPVHKYTRNALTQALRNGRKPYLFPQKKKHVLCNNIYLWTGFESDSKFTVSQDVTMSRREADRIIKILLTYNKNI